MASRPRSPAQIEASRLNGSRSHGPKTAAGKARSRRNALKHGLRAATLDGLDSESRTAARALEWSIAAELQPRTSLEHELVDGVAMALWRLRRARQVEMDLLGGARPEGEALRLSRAFLRDAHGPRALDLLTRYRNQALAEVGRLLRVLGELRREDVTAIVARVATRIEAAGIAPAANDDRPLIAVLSGEPTD